MTGQESITPVAGPLGRSAEDLDLFFRIVSDSEPWLKEPLLGMPWRTEEPDPNQKVTFGVMNGLVSTVAVTNGLYFGPTVSLLISVLSLCGSEQAIAPAGLRNG